MEMKQPWIWVLIGLMILAPLGGAQAENRALIIGVGKYQAPGADLPGIDKDVNMMREAARMLGYKDHQIRVLRDSQATLAGIRGAIKDWLVDGVSPEDRVLFYFSGHGAFIPDENGDEISDGKDEVLLPHDMEIGSGTLLKAFVDDHFGEDLQLIPSRMTVVLIDSCHSGTATKGVNGRYSKFFTYPGMPRGGVKGRFAVVERSHSDNGYVGLSASRDDQQALATQNGSLFTLGVLEAVKKAANSTKSLTINELQRSTEAYIARNSGDPSRVHHPQPSGDVKMRDKNIFLAAVPPPPPPSQTDIWQKLETLTARADYPVKVRTNRTRFQVGQLLKITCEVPSDGYLNILNVSPGDQQATVLFPNRYNPNNRVRRGQTVAIPGSGDNFEFKADEPYGKSLVVVFHTQKPINAYREGKGDPQALFRMLSTKSFRGFEVTERESGGTLGAGKVVAEIQP